MQHSRTISHQKPYHREFPKPSSASLPPSHTHTHIHHTNTTLGRSPLTDDSRAVKDSKHFAAARRKVIAALENAGSASTALLLLLSLLHRVTRWGHVDDGGERGDKSNSIFHRKQPRKRPQKDMEWAEEEAERRGVAVNIKTTAEACALACARGTAVLSTDQWDMWRGVQLWVLFNEQSYDNATLYE